jgi:hypothetical protein
VTPALPAECTQCGHRFQPERGISIDESSNITIGQYTTRCPECHGIARGLSGTFNVKSGAIEMLEGPDWSWDLVAGLGLALRRAVTEDLPDPLAPVVRASPEFAAQVTAAVVSGLQNSPVKATSKNRRKLTKRVLAALGGLLMFDYENTEQNLLVIKTSVEFVLRYVAQHGAVPPPWG